MFSRPFLLSFLSFLFFGSKLTSVFFTFSLSEKELHRQIFHTGLGLYPEQKELVARTLLGAPGIAERSIPTIRNKKLLVALGIATCSKKLLAGAHRY